MNYYIKEYTIKELEKNDFRIYDFKRFFNFDMKILEIGCSTGNFLAINPKKIEGIDIDKKAIDVCKKRKLNAKYMDSSKKLKFKDNSFNGIYMADVISAFTDPLFVMKEIKRVLKPGGKLIIRNQDIDSTRVQKIFWTDYTYKRAYNRASLIRLTTDADFSKHKVYKDVNLFKGLGFLIRNNLLTLKQIEKFQNFFNYGDRMILEAVK